MQNNCDQTHQTVSHGSTRQPEREERPAVPDPGEAVRFGVSSANAPQGSILQTHGPDVPVARHLGSD